jgi:hypothetical protein
VEAQLRNLLIIESVLIAPDYRLVMAQTVQEALTCDFHPDAEGPIQ